MRRFLVLLVLLVAGCRSASAPDSSGILDTSTPWHSGVSKRALPRILQECEQPQIDDGEEDTSIIEPYTGSGWDCGHHNIVNAPDPCGSFITCKHGDVPLTGGTLHYTKCTTGLQGCPTYYELQLELTEYGSVCWSEWYAYGSTEPMSSTDPVVCGEM
jgi:hypothetical protein